MKLRLAQATASKRSKKSPKASKKTAASRKFRELLKVKTLVIIAFVLVFASVGTAMLLRSRAEVPVDSRCDNSYLDIPGGGLTRNEPTVAQVRNQIYTGQDWQMIVVARGLDNAVWFTAMDSVKLRWRNEWKSLGGQTYKTPKINPYSTTLNPVPGRITALGTDNNTYSLQTAYTWWGSWQYLSDGYSGYNTAVNTTVETPSNYVYSVRKDPYSQHVQYKCFRR